MGLRALCWRRTMTVVLPFRRATDFHIDVPDDFEPALGETIADTVRRTLGHLAGVWSVSVGPLAERNRWRIELQSALGRHIWTFLGRRDQLPHAVDDKLRMFLHAATVYRRSDNASPALARGQHAR
jgi:hypothetical protein